MQVKYMQVSLAEPKDTHMSGSGKKNLATRNFEMLAMAMNFVNAILK